jgi:hypothetical protein
MPEEHGYMLEERGYMLEECGYMLEERGYMTEERNYMEEKKTMNLPCSLSATPHGQRRHFARTKIQHRWTKSFFFFYFHN